MYKIAVEVKTGDSWNSDAEFTLDASDETQADIERRYDSTDKLATFIQNLSKRNRAMGDVEGVRVLHASLLKVRGVQYLAED